MKGFRGDLQGHLQENAGFGGTRMHNNGVWGIAANRKRVVLPASSWTKLGDRILDSFANA